MRYKKDTCFLNRHASGILAAMLILFVLVLLFAKNKGPLTICKFGSTNPMGQYQLGFCLSKPPVSRGPLPIVEPDLLENARKGLHN